MPNESAARWVHCSRISDEIEIEEFRVKRVEALVYDAERKENRKTKTYTITRGNGKG